MARCPDCNKFVGFDTDTDPEVEVGEIDTESGTVEATVRIVNNCAECGTGVICDCPVCGAPNCCPRCCDEATKEAQTEIEK